MKFNEKPTPVVVNSASSTTVNHEGATAYNLSPKKELYLLASTALIEPQFYQRSSHQLQRIKDLVKKVNDQRFVLQLAAYVRNKMNLRSVAIVLLAEASQLTPVYGAMGNSLLRMYVPKILVRADEPLELMAYWIDNIGDGKKNNLPNALKRGIADAIAQYDEYQLGKYWRGNSRKSKVKPKDVLRICHIGNNPDEKMKSKAQMVYSDTLPIPQTWETYISKNGSNKDNWNHIAPQMGIMALVRNARNFIQHGADEAINLLVEKLRSPEEIKRSRMLPFRWYAAWRELQAMRRNEENRPVINRVCDALALALDLSVANIEGWKGRTAIFVDVSGSMSAPISKRSTVSCIDIACVLGAMAASLSTGGEYLVGAFACDYKPVNDLRVTDSILTNVDRIRNMEVGCSTNAHLAFLSMLENKQKFDRVILLSDMQCYNSRHSHIAMRNHADSNEKIDFLWKQYRETINPEARLYSIDLTGYGTSQTPENDPSVNLIGGWSERIFDYMSATESDMQDVITEISEQW